MRIGIVSNFNPIELKQYLDQEHDVPDTKVMASSVQALVSGFIKLGHEVVVFSPCSARYTQAKSLRELKGNHLKVYLVRSIPKIDNYIKHLYMPGKLAQCIKMEVQRLDVLHAQWTYECSAATLDFVSSQPTFCSVRDWWPVQYEYYKKNKSLESRILWGVCNRALFKRTVSESLLHLIANSEYTRSKILELFPDYVVPIIPNPINESYIVKDKPYNFNGVFITIANSVFEERKNIYTLLYAFRKFRQEHVEAKLIVVGGYSMDSEDYKHAVNDSLTEGVEFCGLLKHEELIDRIDESSVLVHPSLEETYGNILLEGMARRVLVIGGERAGAVPSVLGNGKYGLLCDVTQADCLLEKMVYASGNLTQCSSIVESATDYLLNGLTDVAIAKQHLSLYGTYL